MRELHKRLLRMLGAVPEEEDASAVLLGPDHPLTRALALARTVAAQFLVSAAALALSAVAVAAGVARSDDLLGSALVVTLALALVLELVRRAVRGRALALVAGGDDAVPLGVVQRERRRLLSRGERERLARSLERFRRDALRPHLLRLPGVVSLRYLHAEVSAVVRLLRSDRPRARGVALVSLLLSDGVHSPLYSGDVESLRAELNRIRFILEGPPRATTVSRALAA